VSTIDEWKRREFFFSYFGVLFNFNSQKWVEKKLFTKMDKIYQLDRHNFKLVKIKVTCWQYQLITLIKIVSLSSIIFLTI